MPGSNLNVYPLHIPFIFWADAVVIDNPNFPRAISEEQWEDWAMCVREIDGNAPDPRSFADWRKWAQSWMGCS